MAEIPTGVGQRLPILIGPEADYSLPPIVTPEDSQPLTDTADLSQAIPSPDLLLPKPPQADDRPIWQRENAERYSSAPGLDKYVIWKYKPGDEGVREFPRFDNLDPLPHHYYKSQEEYERARSVYNYGGYEDQLVEIVSFPSWESRERSSASSEITILNNPDIADSFDKAA